MSTRTRSPEAQAVFEAQAKLREYAESADPSLWARAAQASAEGKGDADAWYVAVMSPAVGLAAADFLAAVQEWDDEHSTGLTWSQPVPARALAIAYAVLGRTA